MAKKKKPTYRFFVYKNGERVNVETLTPEEQEYTKQWVLENLARGLGYAPVGEKR